MSGGDNSGGGGTLSLRYDGREWEMLELAVVSEERTGTVQVIYVWAILVPWVNN